MVASQSRTLRDGHSAAAFAGLALLISAAAAASLPPSFKRCHQKDPNFQECVRDGAENALRLLKDGAPSLGIVPLDPLHVDKLAIGEGNGAVSIGLTFENLEIHGISNSTVLSHKCVPIDFHKYEMSADAHTPVLTVNSDYSVKGRILLLPVFGQGRCSILLRNLQSHVEHRGVPYEHHGKVYLNETQFTYTLHPGDVEMNFENLFNGDRILGKNMNIFLNENWPEVLEEIKPAFEDALGQIFLTISHKLFITVPLNEIFLL